MSDKLDISDESFTEAAEHVAGFIKLIRLSNAEVAKYLDIVLARAMFSISQSKVDELLEYIKILEKGIDSVTTLISDSQGVYGLHLNGDPAPWLELIEGGRFEEWLVEFSQAEQARNARIDK